MNRQDLTNTFGPNDLMKLRSAYSKASDLMGFGPDAQKERTELARVMLRFARIVGVTEEDLIKETIALLRFRSDVNRRWVGFAP